MNTNSQPIAATITALALRAANNNDRKAKDEWPLLRALRRANSRILRDSDSAKIFIAIAQAFRRDGLRASAESEKGLSGRMDDGDWFDFGTINTDAIYSPPWGFDDGSGEYVSPSMGWIRT